ncbi:DMT family transporter [Ferrovum sp. PN-J185]|uniref:DMT family transporter n=1 Tax=Ferrovum sp. PN-J185 TaxID=1356306 RepID=UPI00082CEF94|nr:DMT family transporter [Ferrovum sp. PN-J185]MCC6067668.1 DMT family transporter [Ferrovum sp. PN-J185]
MTQRSWFPILALVLLSSIWGYTWVLAKQALSLAPPFAFAAQRCIGGALALFVLLKLTNRPLKCAEPKATMWIGLVQVAGFMALQTWALVEGGPGKTSVLIFTMPIWTLLLARVFLGEVVKGVQWVAAILTLVGLIFIIEPWNMHASALSKLLGILAAVCWSVGTIQVKLLRQKSQVDLINLTTWQMVVGAVPLTLLAVLVPEGSTQWSAHYIYLLVFMSVTSTGLCWWLWIYILDRVPAWEASLSVLGTPVIAILSSRFILNEAFKVVEITGILMIGIGLSLLSFIGWLTSRRQA